MRALGWCALAIGGTVVVETLESPNPSTTGGYGTNCRSDANQQIKLDTGKSQSWFCDHLDGSAPAWMFYWQKFKSVNNDLYSFQYFGYEDTKGVRSNESWCHFGGGQYNDNFEHAPNLMFPDCSGRFINTSMEVRLNCITPGSGSQCQLLVESSAFGNYNVN